MEVTRLTMSIMNTRVKTVVRRNILLIARRLAQNHSKRNGIIGRAYRGMAYVWSVSTVR